MIPLIFLAALATTAPPANRARVAAAPKHPHVARASLAPADEYFGPLKMSAIFIRARIGALGRRYDARTESDDDLVHDAGDVQTAMFLWHDRYPHDTWLPPTALHLAELYQEIQTDAARKLARDAFAYVAAQYPKSSYAHLARVRLAAGFPPLHDESPVVTASASPEAAASAGPSPAPSGSPAGAPSAVPSLEAVRPGA